MKSHWWNNINGVLSGYNPDWRNNKSGHKPIFFAQIGENIELTPLNTTSNLHTLVSSEGR